MKPLHPLLRAGALALCVLPLAANAEAPAYKADISFGQGDIKSPLAISVDDKDAVFVLLRDGTVLCYDTAGKKTGSFNTGLKEVSTLTSGGGKVYVFNNRTELKEIEYRGRKIKQQVPGGVGCTVFDTSGAKARAFDLPQAKNATDAHLMGTELAVADYAGSAILVYDLSGDAPKPVRKIVGAFRLCCGIFDFHPAGAGAVVAANLGAFKVQTFTGAKKTAEFGKRGDKPEDFTGCCNPVNIATLADGTIVTVEKSPTRVKTFDKENKTAKRIAGLGELVKGCSTIPVAVDSANVIYLLSDTKNCVVKCVPGSPDQPEPEPEPEEDEADFEAPAWAKALEEKVVPLIEAEEWDKARAAAEELIKAHPDMDGDDKAQVMLVVTVMPLVYKGDEAGALKAVDAILAAYPDSSLKDDAGEIKDGIREAIAQRKAGNDEEPAADNTPADDKADDKADTPPAKD
jgi:hypothetical protein